jgi:hypothetical protein
MFIEVGASVGLTPLGVICLCCDDVYPFARKPAVHKNS